VTPTVFCAVMAVSALVPKTPSAANVFRSAWMPAPPPESEPAMVRATGRDATRTAYAPRGGHAVGTALRAVLCLESLRPGRDGSPSRPASSGSGRRSEPSCRHRHAASLPPRPVRPFAVANGELLAYGCSSHLVWRLLMA